MSKKDTPGIGEETSEEKNDSQMEGVEAALENNTNWLAAKCIPCNRVHIFFDGWGYDIKMPVVVYIPPRPNDHSEITWFPKIGDIIGCDGCRRKYELEFLKSSQEDLKEEAQLKRYKGPYWDPAWGSETEE